MTRERIHMDSRLTHPQNNEYWEEASFLARISYQILDLIFALGHDVFRVSSGL